MKVTASEELKLKQGAVPSNLASTLIETDSEFFRSRTLHFLTASAENLSRKFNGTWASYWPYTPANSLGNEISIEEIVHQFAVKHPRHMRLCNILSD